MSETSTLIGCQGKTIDREALALVPTPLATDTHRPDSTSRNRHRVGRNAGLPTHRRGA